MTAQCSTSAVGVTDERQVFPLGSALTISQEPLAFADLQIYHNVIQDTTGLDTESKTTGVSRLEVTTTISHLDQVPRLVLAFLAIGTMLVDVCGYLRK